MSQLDTLFIDYLKTMLRSPSVTGSEHAFFRCIQRELDSLDIKSQWYEGMLVAQGSQPEQGSLSAHVDRHGLLCTGPQEFQYAAYSASQKADLLGNSIAETMWNTIASRFIGNKMIAYEPWSGVYRGKGTITAANLCPRQNNLIFTIEGLDHLVAGAPVAYEDKLNIKDDHLFGQLDNAISVAMILYLYSQGYQGRAFFTAGEECGKSWRYLLEWFNRFDPEFQNLIVLDTSPFQSQDDADKQQIVLRHRDANGVFNADMVAKTLELCGSLGISTCFKEDYIVQLNIERAARDQKPLPLGTTELGRLISVSESRLNGMSIQLPTSGYHTQYESVHIDSCNSLVTLLKNKFNIQ